MQSPWSISGALYLGGGLTHEVMPGHRSKHWNALAVLSLALSIAGYLIIQGGALPNKKKKAHPPAAVEILSDTQS